MKNGHNSWTSICTAKHFCTIFWCLVNMHFSFTVNGRHLFDQYHKREKKYYSHRFIRSLHIEYSREINSTAFMMWCIPYKIGAFFISIVCMSDRCTFRNCFGILTVLPWANPFVSFGISGLYEKSTEMVATTNGNCKSF